MYTLPLIRSTIRRIINNLTENKQQAVGLTVHLQVMSYAPVNVSLTGRRVSRRRSAGMHDDN